MTLKILAALSHWKTILIRKTKYVLLVQDLIPKLRGSLKSFTGTFTHRRVVGAIITFIIMPGIWMKHKLKLTRLILIYCMKFNCVDTYYLLYDKNWGWISSCFKQFYCSNYTKSRWALSGNRLARKIIYSLWGWRDFTLSIPTSTYIENVEKYFKYTFYKLFADKDYVRYCGLFLVCYLFPYGAVWKGYQYFRWVQFWDFAQQNRHQYLIKKKQK